MCSRANDKKGWGHGEIRLITTVNGEFSIKNGILKESAGSQCRDYRLCLKRAIWDLKSPSPTFSHAYHMLRLQLTHTPQVCSHPLRLWAPWYWAWYKRSRQITVSKFWKRKKNLDPTAICTSKYAIKDNVIFKRPFRSWAIWTSEDICLVLY